MKSSETTTPAIEPVKVRRLPRSAVDAHGRFLPTSDEERKARSEHARIVLKRLSETPPGETDTDEIWENVMRGIDEGRPHRKLFEGRY